MMSVYTIKSGEFLIKKEVLLINTLSVVSKDSYATFLRPSSSK